MTPDNHDVVENFTHKKAAAEDRGRSLAQELTKQERLNRALRVGRAPTILVDTLKAISQAGLSEHFLLLGTRKQVKFVSQMKRLDSSFLGLLQKKVDKTFRLHAEQR